jgi:hypothetical protein
MEIEGSDQFNMVVGEMTPLTAKLKVFGTYKKEHVK